MLFEELHPSVNIQVIDAWLKKCNVKNYNINTATGVVDVDVGVNIQEWLLKANTPNDHIPFQFGTVKGFFVIQPHNTLKSLQGCPNIVNGQFKCADNINITSAVGGPQIIYGNADYSNTGISNVTGLPKEVHGDLNISSTFIVDFSNIYQYTKIVDGNINIHNMQYQNIHNGLVGFFKIKKLKQVLISPSAINMPKEKRFAQAINIVNKHLAGDRYVTECQQELEDAGLSEYAML